MNRKKLSDLQEVFVSFEADKIEGTSIVFFNKYLECELAEEEILSRYSYVVGGNESVRKLGRLSKIFYAERYGGDGIARNGGGGRCGFDGRFHLKGAGPNQLVGGDADAAHGNGCLFLDTAIYESIWAEIINIALPYGAIRTLAVLDAGYDFEESGWIKARGLLVREPVVRPAHFIRAVYFKERQFNRVCADAIRVRAAIHQLVDFLPEGSGGVSDGSLHERLAAGMVELARRYAKQFSAARAKRIIHFNVSASNLSLDGAWLDLSSTRVFSQLIGGDRLKAKRFLTEHLPAIESIKSMCYYLSKYLVVSNSDAIEICERAIEGFHREYESCLCFYNAMHVGFPLVILEFVVDDPAYLEFSRCLAKVLAFDDFSVSWVTTDLGWKGWEHGGRRLYLELLRGKSIKGHVPDLSWLKLQLPLVDQLVSSYGQLFDVVCDRAKEMGISRESLVRFLAINLTRLNRCHALLFDLDKTIDEARGRARPIKNRLIYEGLIEEAVSMARLTFANDEKFRIPIWTSNLTDIEYDLILGVFFINNSVEDSGALSDLLKVSSHANEVNKAVSFYNDIWSFV